MITSRRMTTRQRTSLCALIVATSILAWILVLTLQGTQNRHARYFRSPVLLEGSVLSGSFSKADLSDFAYCDQGTRIVGVGYRGHLRLFDSANGKSLRCIALHRIKGTQFLSGILSPDGKIAAFCLNRYGPKGAGKDTKFFRFARADTGMSLGGTMPFGYEFEGEIPAMSFSLDSEYFAFGDRSGRLRVYFLGDGRRLQERVLPTHSSGICAIGFSPSNEILVADFSSGVCAVDTQTKSKIWEKPDVGILWDVDWSSQDFILGGTSDGQLLMIDTDTKEIVDEVKFFTKIPLVIHRLTESIFLVAAGFNVHQIETRHGTLSSKAIYHAPSEIFGIAADLHVDQMALNPVHENILVDHSFDVSHDLRD